MAGVDGLLVGRPRPLHITLLFEQGPEVAPGSGGRVGVAGVDGLLVGRPRPLHITLVFEQGSEVIGRPGGLVGVAGVDGLLVGRPRPLHITLLLSRTPRLRAAMGAASAWPESMACW